MSLILIAVLVLQGNVQSYATPLPLNDEPFEAVALPPEALSLKSLPDANVQPIKNHKLDSKSGRIGFAARYPTNRRWLWLNQNHCDLSENRVHV